MIGGEGVRRDPIPMCKVAGGLAQEETNGRSKEKGLR